MAIAILKEKLKALNVFIRTQERFKIHKIKSFKKYVSKYINKIYNDKNRNEEIEKTHRSSN